MPAWIQTIELTVQHVRKPGQWVPVAEERGRESPDHAVSGQSRLDTLVFEHVPTVIELNERMTGRLPVDGAGDEKKKQNDDSF
jgi:hypothetical protein